MKISTANWNVYELLGHQCCRILFWEKTEKTSTTQTPTTMRNWNADDLLGNQLLEEVQDGPDHGPPSAVEYRNVRSWARR